MFLQADARDTDYIEKVTENKKACPGLVPATLSWDKDEPKG